MAHTYKIPCFEIDGRLKDAEGRLVYYVAGKFGYDKRKRKQEGDLITVESDSDSDSEQPKAKCLKPF